MVLLVLQVSLRGRVRGRVRVTYYSATMVLLVLQVLG